MSTATPFKIAIPDSDIAALKQKLDLVRFPDELDDAGREYGVPLADLKRLVARWKDEYDWRKHEAELNELPMFTRGIEVDGFGTLDIHYVHQESDVEGAISLLFVHGWPGSFIEVQKILPLLTASSAEHPSFHVVGLGLPGYGFSEAPKKKGFAAKQFAEVGHKLMLALGYDEYVTQGGDWGSLITRVMSNLYGPKHVKAWHTNMPTSFPPRLFSHPLQYIKHLVLPYTAEERRRLTRASWFAQQGRGYFEEHATQPQTIGYALADSPTALLAWIYEKLVNWTDKYEWDDDEVLTWISIYWFSRAGPAASVRIYYETRKSGERLNPPRTKVPLGISYFPQELALGPNTWIKTIGNLVYESAIHEKGGHFAAHERPEDLAGDLRKMFGRGGPAYGLVKGKNGF
ncbi:hypothetical protein HETIRDRAFT_61404 [Heterobasidion irregulare TC 32-1]|uniref:Epoxide hydrolase N-terminal domain-containing protein n=1 Tax=Heterobasidion irregulare (strain TC 32-1) TaxID=747525 RepID=W4K896_HETIT|nr:uncharacterized protein HETIRDRAFT_61404 [Heterobasidion irregulare TC 32-1]ETW82018.1 hypothetical protein HETIRDRAFT_61404 [Heterobasidion irregulare TC 32-1]